MRRLYGIGGIMDEQEINYREMRGKIMKMIVPVLCNHCSTPYDLCDGIPIHRYQDCTVYKTPCCGRVVDDREYNAHVAFTRINKNEI